MVVLVSSCVLTSCLLSPALEFDQILSAYLSGRPPGFEFELVP